MAEDPRGRDIEHGDADICQEIGNSNKLVAKRSNSLPNGTVSPGGKPVGLVNACACAYGAASCTDITAAHCQYKISALLRHTIHRELIMNKFSSYLYFSPNSIVILLQKYAVTLITRRSGRNSDIIVFHAR